MTTATATAGAATATTETKPQDTANPTSTPEGGNAATAAPAAGGKEPRKREPRGAWFLILPKLTTKSPKRQSQQCLRSTS